MKSLSLTVILCFFSAATWAQSSPEMLDSLTEQARKEANFKRALVYAKQAAEASKKQHGIDSFYVVRRNKIAKIYSEIDNELCETAYKDILPIAEKVAGKQSLLYASALVNLSHPLTLMQKNEEALELLNKAVDIYKALKTPISYTDYRSARSNIAANYFYLSDFETAEPLYLEVINNMKKDTANVEEEVYNSVLTNYAILLIELQKIAAAKDILNEVLELKRKKYSEQHPNFANALNNMAYAYQKIGEPATAEKYFKQALKIFKEKLGESHLEYIRATVNLGSFYYLYNQIDDAEKFLKAGLILAQKHLGNNNPTYIDALNSLSAVYYNTKAYDKAEKLLLEAIDISKKNKKESSPYHIMMLNNAAQLYNGMKALKKATALAVEALQLNSPEANANLFSDGKISDIKALENINFAYTEDALTSINSLIQILENEYRDHKNLAALDQIDEYVRVAAAITQKTKMSFTSEEDKFILLSKFNPFIRSGLWALAMKKIENPLAAVQNRAFELAELNKSNLLYAALRAAKARQFGVLPEAMANKEQELQKKHKLLQKQLLDSNIEQTQKIALRKELNDLALEIDAFSKELAQKHPQYFKQKYSEATTNTASIQKLLKPGTALIEFSIANGFTHIVFITNDTIDFRAIEIKKADLNASIKALRQALSDYEFIKNKSAEAYKAYTENAFLIYDKLLSGFLNDYKNLNHLIIIPDGDLNHIPFEALLSNAVTQTEPYHKLPYLLNKYKISYNYAASLWVENLNHRAQNNGKLLGIAASYAAQGDSIRNRGNRSVQLRNLRKTLQDLPAAKAEVEALSKIYPGTFLYGDDASEANFKSKAEKFGIIHLAMHGLLNEQYPVLSSLAFTEEGNEKEDNFLQAFEISQLKLNAELVVLSACETGYGKFQQGEGVMSLARSFMYAGIPSLVVSMWQVNDASTSLIMQLFYKNLAKGMDKAEALRQAKLDYISSVGRSSNTNDMAAHPAYWAPFVQIGDNRPISVSSKNGAMTWWIIGGVGLLALGGAIAFALRRRRNEN